MKKTVVTQGITETKTFLKKNCGLKTFLRLHIRETKGWCHMLEAQTEVKQNKNKRTSKRNTLVLTDEIKSQVSDSLRQMISEVKERKQEKAAETIIRENLKFIDELSKDGATLKQIFERINKIVKLGISPSSFAVYVRRIKQKFQCEFCEKEAVLIDASEFSDLKIKAWICKKCSTMYKNKKNTLTAERISKKAEEKIRHDFAIHDTQTKRPA